MPSGGARRHLLGLPLGLGLAAQDETQALAAVLKRSDQRQVPEAPLGTAASDSGPRSQDQ